jgi:DNA-binding MarR family transcriptional regulator
LEAEGWVQRSPHPEDRRQSIISITPSGRTLLDEEAKARDEWLATRLADFSAEEIRVLTEAVTVLDRLGSE